MSSLLVALARAAELLLHEFRAEELANTTWAFSKVDQSNEKLFAAFVSAAKLRASEFSEQNLANAAWAFAKVTQCDGELFAVLARVGCWLSEFKP